MSKKAKLRVCASCEWIFNEGVECPKCGFGSYGARYVYGDKAYRYKNTQQPWLDKKVSDYTIKLLKEITPNKNGMSKLSDKLGFDEDEIMLLYSHTY